MKNPYENNEDSPSDTSQLNVAFVKQFEKEMHEAYQRLGSKLRSTVQQAGNVKGSSTVFQKIGKGIASTKSIHGMVPVINASYSAVECPLHDYYVGDWVENINALKFNYEERQLIANAGGLALGRKTDELIIDALSSADTLTIADGNIGMTRDKVLKAFELLGKADAPDDGKRFAVVGWQQWSELLKIPEFANSEFIGPDDLPYKGTQAKRWLGTTWIAHSGLPIDGNDVRKCFWFHKNAIGHAWGADVATTITWNADRKAHFVNNFMAQGATLIDSNAIVVTYCNETPD